MKKLSMILSYFFAWASASGLNEWLMRDNEGGLVFGIFAVIVSLVLASASAKKLTVAPLGFAYAIRGLINISVYFNVPLPSLLISGILFVIPGILLLVVPILISKVRAVRE